MLPDFVEVKEGLQRIATLRLREQVRRSDPVLAMIQHHIQHEGRESVYTTMSGTERRTPYEQAVGEVTIDMREAVTMSIAEFMTRVVDRVADKMLAQIMPSIFATVKQATDAVGNVVDAGGKPFSFDLFLQSLEKMWIDFDEETGKPKLPTIVVSPELGERVREMLPEWEKNEHYKRRFSELIDLKREEWNDRESHRKLVD